MGTKEVKKKMSKLGGNHITIETRNRGTEKERIWKVFGLSADWHLDQTSEYRNSFPFTVKFTGGLDGSSVLTDQTLTGYSRRCFKSSISASFCFKLSIRVIN